MSKSQPPPPGSKTTTKKGGEIRSQKGVVLLPQPQTLEGKSKTLGLSGVETVNEESSTPRTLGCTLKRLEGIGVDNSTRTSRGGPFRDTLSWVLSRVDVCRPRVTIGEKDRRSRGTEGPDSSPRSSGVFYVRLNSLSVQRFISRGPFSGSSPSSFPGQLPSFKFRCLNTRTLPACRQINKKKGKVSTHSTQAFSNFKLDEIFPISPRAV